MWYEGIHVDENGKRRRLRFRVVSARPSGDDLNLEIDFGDDPLRISLSSIEEVVVLETGEEIDDPRSHFLNHFFDRVSGGDGVPLWAAIDALPIHGIGPTRSVAIARHFGTWGKFRQAFTGMEAWEVYNGLWIDGVGISTVHELCSFFADPGQSAAFDRSLGGRRIAEHADAEGPLAGQVVCFTGTLETLGRLEAQAKARQAGAEIATGLSRRTTLVVAGLGAGDSKLRRAAEAGIPVIDEAAFLSRLREN